MGVGRVTFSHKWPMRRQYVFIMAKNKPKNELSKSIFFIFSITFSGDSASSFPEIIMLISLKGT